MTKHVASEWPHFGSPRHSKAVCCNAGVATFDVLKITSALSMPSFGRLEFPYRVPRADGPVISVQHAEPCRLMVSLAVEQFSRAGSELSLVVFLVDCFGNHAVTLSSGTVALSDAASASTDGFELANESDGDSSKPVARDLEGQEPVLMVRSLDTPPVLR